MVRNLWTPHTLFSLSPLIVCFFSVSTGLSRLTNQEGELLWNLSMNMATVKEQRDGRTPFKPSSQDIS